MKESAGRCCSAHLSPVVIDNDGALLIIHCDCAHITLPWDKDKNS